ncbi:MAG: universal stress protein [Dehalococcoidia bacterium]|nr:universal stress protein [Dehalococcoidia bacterium]
MFKIILVAYDGSEHSKKALLTSVSLSKAFGSRIVLVSVEENVTHYAADIGEVKEEKQRLNGLFQRLQREARETVKMSGMDLSGADILVGNVPRAIIEYAKTIKCDLIVMGSSGRSGAWVGLLGTTVDKVSHHAPCSVLIVR